MGHPLQGRSTFAHVDDHVQAAGVDDTADRGANRVTEDPGSFHRGSFVVEERVVAGQLDYPGGCEGGDEVGVQSLSEQVHGPGAVPQEPVAGFVGPAPWGESTRQHAKRYVVIQPFGTLRGHQSATCHAERLTQLN